MSRSHQASIQTNSPASRSRDLLARYDVDLSDICVPLQLTPDETQRFGEELVARTSNWREIVTELEAATHPRLKYPLKVVGQVGPQRVEITTNAADYMGANFVIQRKPLDSSLQCVENVQCGYSLSDGFRRLLSLTYIALDENGKIIEVGGASDEALDVFREHIFGRTADATLASRIAEINSAVFEMLRQDPKADARVQEFAQSREWPTGLAEKAGLAYFHANKTPLLEWAAQSGFTPREMFDAGWFDLSIGLNGQAHYGPNGSNVIRIPYYNNSGELTIWRTRNLSIQSQDKHKYLSWPLNRAIEREFEVGEKLYFGWRLHEIEGRDIIITEGEFKCLVAWELSGVPTFGIPGITEVNRDMLSEIIAAKPASITVVLDRDAGGKALGRIDGITDSARAAFRIGRDIEELGFTRVKIGVIPDVRNGAKVGLDDLILDTDPSSVQRLLSSATSVDEYREKIGLDSTFAELLRRRQMVRKALLNYSTSSERGGTQLEPSRLKNMVEFFKELSSGYRQYLLERFRGARRIDQTSHEYGSLFRVPTIDRENEKLAIDSRGTLIPLERFRNDIALLHFATSDVPSENQFCLANDQRLPIAMSTIRAYFDGFNRDAEVTKLLRRGIQMLCPREDPLHYAPSTLRELSYLILAGYLQSIFPSDEYTYERNIAIFDSNRDYWEHVVDIPLTISRKGRDVVAIAAMPVFEHESRMKLALHQTNRLWTRLSLILRRPELPHMHRKLEDIGGVLLEHYGPQVLDSTAQTLAPLGITSETCRRERLMVFTPETWNELLKHLSFKKLTTQAAENGLYGYTADGVIIPRFKGDVVLLPIIGASGTVQSLRVFPLSMADQIPPASPPDCKPVFSLFGAGRSRHRRFQGDRLLYRSECLSQATEQQLIVAFNEWDALHISQHTAHVVGLHSSLQVPPTVLHALRDAAPAELLLILPPEVRSKYDPFSFDGIPGIVKEAYDLQLQLSQLVRDEHDGPPEGTVISTKLPTLHVVMPAVSPSQISRFAPESMSDYVAHLSSQALPLSQLLKSQRFNPQIHENVQKFLTLWSRFLEYLEVPALRDPLDKRPIEWWVRNIQRYHAAISQAAASAYHQSIPSLDTMIAHAINSSEPVSFSDVVARRGAAMPEFFRSRALYYPGILRYSSPHSARLRDTISMRAQMVGPDRLNFERLNVLGSRGPEVLGTQSSSEMLSRSQQNQPGTQPNPVSALYEFVQAHTKRLNSLNFDFAPETQAQLSAQLHRCTVSIVFDGATLSMDGIARRKQDAKAQACHNLLDQLTQLLNQESNATYHPQIAAETNPSSQQVDQNQEAYSPEIIAQNFPSQLQEYCDALKLLRPDYEFKSAARGGINVHSCICSLNLGKIKISSEWETARVKQHAKHLAAAAVWRRLQLEDAQISRQTSPDNAKQLQVLFPADGNFIGGLQIFCDRVKIAKPSYEESSVPLNGEYQVRAQLSWNGQQLISDWNYSEAKSKAKQLCAKALCMKLYMDVTGHQFPDSTSSEALTEKSTAPAPQLQSPPATPEAVNYIGALGEYAQRLRLALPEYRDGAASGAEHAKSFTCFVSFTDAQGTLYELTSDPHPTKKAAKSHVAQKLYETILEMK